MGRPTKLTEEVQAAIVESIKRGCTFKAAALAAGIAEGTFFKWMKRGEQAKKGRFFEFRQAIKKAEAEAVSFAVSCIFQQVKKGNWQAAAWWLERRYPEDWGKKERVEMETNNSFPLPREITREDAEEGEIIIEAIDRIRREAKQKANQDCI